MIEALARAGITDLLHLAQLADMLDISPSEIIQAAIQFER